MDREAPSPNNFDLFFKTKIPDDQNEHDLGMNQNCENGIESFLFFGTYSRTSNREHSTSTINPQFSKESKRRFNFSLLEK